MKRDTIFFFGSLAAAILSAGICTAKIRSSQAHSIGGRDVPFTLPEHMVAGDVIGEKAAIRGGINAPYTLVEFGDYQCPPCGQAHSIVKQLVSDNPANLRFVFRHYPLQFIHPNAYRAALAAASAGEQGKFWEMHDLLYNNQTHLSDQDLTRYANSLRLNISQFRSAMQTTAQDRVKSDMQTVQKLKLQYTPTLVLCDPVGRVHVVEIAELQRQFASGVANNAVKVQDSRAGCTAGAACP